MAQQPVVGQGLKTNYKFHIKVLNAYSICAWSAKWFILLVLWRKQRVGLGETF